MVQKTDVGLLDLAKQTVAPMSLKDEAFIAIEKLIVNGELAPGSWVSESELMTVTDLGRAPIRSAIDRLADQQLITVVPRRGARVCPIDFTQQFRALELRRAVEKLLVRSAASRATDAHRAGLSDTARSFREISRSRKQDLMTDVDSKQFQLIIAAAGNLFAAKAMLSVKGLSRRFWVLNHEKHGDIEAMANCHAEIADAISDNSVEEAERALDSLMDYLERFTLKVVGYGS